MKAWIQVAMLAVALGAAPALAPAQGFPNKPMRFVAPFPPGGGTDFVVRPMAQKMSDSMGQPVLVDNRPGADGAIGSEFTARAAPDGYTFMMGTSGTHVHNALFHRKLAYDPLKDFTPITQSTLTIIVLVANPQSGIASVSDLLERARSQPGKLGFASSGIGSPQHLAGELLNKIAGISLFHVPYKGAAPAVTDLLSGIIPLGFVTASTVIPHIKQGKLRALAITEAARYPGLPEVASLGESVRGYEMSTWSGMFAPARLPQPLLQRLNREMTAALKSPDIVAKFEAAGLVVVANTPEQFAAKHASEMTLWRTIVQSLDLARD